MISKRLVLVALLVVGGLAACGKDDVRPASSGEPATTSSTEAPTTTAPAEEAATELTVTGTEYAYATDADTAAIPAGPVTVTLDNAGAEEHQISIVQLKEGKTEADLAGLGNDLSQFDDVVETFGGPNGVAPSASNTTTQVLAAGDYLFVCFIPAPDGVPHSAKGMVLPVTVEGDAPESVAEGDLTIALQDYAFGFGDDALLEAGPYTATNTGPQPHEVAIYSPAEGSTAQDVIDFYANPAPTGPPPAVAAGGIGPIDAGTSASFDLATGEYVFICFIPDAADGAPHFTKGMIQAVSVE